MDKPLHVGVGAGPISLLFLPKCPLCIAPLLALLGLAILPLSFLFTLRASRRIHKVARDQRKRQGAMAATAAESIGGIKVVQTLSLEKVFSQSFSKQNNPD